MGGDHFYTTDPNGELARQSGYVYEGIACYIIPYPAKNLPLGIVAYELHRWFNPQSGDHFYTTILNGELAGSSGYVHEGIAGYVYDPTFPGPIDPKAAPFYRWFSPAAGLHFYTVDPAGELAPQSGFVKEKVEYYVYKDNLLRGIVPFHRWYLPKLANVGPSPMTPGMPGMYFYFRMDNAASQILPCFTVAIYAQDAASAQAIAEAQNGGYTATEIDYGAYLAGC
jgi:hypothetical protein